MQGPRTYEQRKCGEQRRGEEGLGVRSSIRRWFDFELVDRQRKNNIAIRERSRITEKSAMQLFVFVS